jgi:putative flippase GtrA
VSKKALTIALLYTVFASLSTVINIGSQMLSMAIYVGTYAVEISILVGTATGLPLRYLLEKRYIFNFKSRNIKHDGQLFLLYSFMGVFTTAIFWFTEYVFHLSFTDDLMRYVGGVVGLSIGFYIKYRLDKKYVFMSGDPKVML